MFWPVWYGGGTPTLRAQSPLAVYNGPETISEPEVFRQEYHSLINARSLVTDGPINEGNAVSSALRVGEAFGDNRIRPIPQDRNLIGDDKWAVHFGLKYDGIFCMSGTEKMVVFGNDGKPIEYRNRNVPRILPPATKPTVEPDKAKDAAITNMRAFLATGRQRIKQDIELQSSNPTLEIWVDKELRGFLSWTLLVRAKDVRIPLSVQYWVAATGDPRVLGIKDFIYSAHNGDIVGNVWMSTPRQPAKAETPLIGTRVTRMERGDSVITDRMGKFIFPGETLAPDLIIAALFGPNCVLLNDMGAELREQAQTTVNVDTKLNFRAASEEDIAQVTAFYWVNRTAEFTRIGNRLAGVPTRVNLTNDSGNAFWDGFALNFFKSNGNVPNTAYCDFIVHEYGHAVDGRLRGIQSRSYSEGFADSIFMLMTQQPYFGRDFEGPGDPIRDATELVTWEDSDVRREHADPHRVGQVYSGFVWQLVENLRTANVNNPFELVRTLVMDAAEMNPADIPDAVRQMFVADDNDRNLENGTPHYDQLSAAAESRKLPYPKRR